MRTTQNITDELRLLSIEKTKTVKGSRYNLIRYNRNNNHRKHKYLKETFPEFVNKVTQVIYELGTISFNKGDSDELDELKEKAFRIINL